MFVVLQPHSKTNPSNRYRVVFDEDWMKFVNGETESYNHTSYATYNEAIRAAETANERA